MIQVVLVTNMWVPLVRLNPSEIESGALKIFFFFLMHHHITTFKGSFFNASSYQDIATFKGSFSILLGV